VDAPVVARHRGIIRSVHAEEGKRVARGAVLARLDDEEYRLDWERASAMAAQATAEAERARKAITGNLISQRELEVAQARERAARAEEKLARLERDRCLLVAPVSGVVRMSRAEPNAVVEEGEVLFHVSEIGRLKASVYLTRPDFARWKQGTTARVTSLSDPSAPAGTGRVRLANAIADPVTGLHHVEIEVVPGPGLAAGSEVQVDPALDATPQGRSGGLVLPRGAYFERSAGSLSVYRISAGRAQKVAVRLGDGRADGFPVLSGLAAGDLVLAAGELPPAAGSPVQPRLVGSR
jgi:RND family efflux transporter MFP subunit